MQFLTAAVSVTTLRPSSRASPLSGRVRQDSILMVVVFPAPLTPAGRTAPLPDRQVQAVHGSDGPVALGQALYFDGVHFCASFSLNRANTPMYTSVSDALISSVSQSRKDVAAMEAMPWT